MGFDFDENGNNEEYGASENEPTGEPGDKGKPAQRKPAAPLHVASAPVLHGDVNDLIANVMGKTQPQTAPQTVAQALEITQDSYMDDVDERLEIADYYRSALSNPMFDNDTKAARIVQHEFSGFIRQRLGELLNLPGDAKKPEAFSDAQIEVLRLLGDLTPDHVTALKLVASKLVGTPPPPREEPVLRQAKAPTTPTPRVAPTPRQAPSPPPTTPIETPQPKRGPGRPPGAKNAPKKEPEMVQAIRKHPDGTEEPLFYPDGSPVMRKVEQPKKVQRPAGMLPFPTETQMTTVTELQAADRVAKLERNPEVQKAMVGLKNPM